ncbi:hypothetical protein BV22DRAFT_152115 [Leucogyrophana mollusca]|uniref:Uncharacterized protein n=1 Tax=Leucogyrophana mollusca TaxID=85980 RepID=A0ACB8BSW0_9AGAM|nr:hypothetical protein BV22DRAFT_152115 [Leucogyrophana mollusca]
MSHRGSNQSQGCIDRYHGVFMASDQRLAGTICRPLDRTRRYVVLLIPECVREEPRRRCSARALVLSRRRSLHLLEGRGICPVDRFASLFLPLSYLFPRLLRQTPWSDESRVPSRAQFGVLIAHRAIPGALIFTRRVVVKTHRVAQYLCATPCRSSG